MLRMHLFARTYFIDFCGFGGKKHAVEYGIDHNEFSERDA